MAKFKKKTNTSEEIPTSALPDIIFMLLFFFMVTTVMRENTLMVENKLPAATQLTKLEQKSLVSYIYIGKPKEVDKFGKEPRIQLNDALFTPDEIPMFVLSEKDKLDEAEKDKITMSLKVDKEAKMGIVTDVRQQLREANALKVNYSSLPGAL
ncbi:biopolymer transporter ExbD [Flammeovirgaceae bacterium SG7u.111]|nr:biopolymer transporter ExbD [Flammeovirgaceae bacterium SG7u.132]WPO36855.1 biopolymer transporter ExbD [Flammeovirgaceae bacterium SG7u.111]